MMIDHPVFCLSVPCYDNFAAAAARELRIGLDVIQLARPKGERGSVGCEGRKEGQQQLVVVECFERSCAIYGRINWLTSWKSERENLNCIARRRRSRRSVNRVPLLFRFIGRRGCFATTEKVAPFLPFTERNYSVGRKAVLYFDIGVNSF